MPAGMHDENGQHRPSCWVVTDGSAGMENQCIGLAEALGLDFTVKRIATTRPWRWLPPQLWLDPLKRLSPQGDLLTPPWPDVLITCGRQAIPMSLAIKRPTARTHSPTPIRTRNGMPPRSVLWFTPDTAAFPDPTALAGLGRLAP